ncbi:DUF4192 domain-containing protein [Streptomyces sp. NPDC098781]|uniref:DUF4192 domain-containing protein n=1 Tax=Streptomyces sp. NPDC098781 TaxID=3366097 RepID=UPI0038298A7B
MTNHSGTTGSSDHDDASGEEQRWAPGATDSANAAGGLRDVWGGRDVQGRDEAQAGHDVQDAGHDVQDGEKGQNGPRPRPVDPLDCPVYEAHLPQHQVTLRSPSELADALPYLLGYRPEDSIVLVAIHDKDGRGRFGGRARLGIPASADDWDDAAGQLAHGLVTGSERRGTRPEEMVAFLCQEPGKGETGRQVMERLRPLAQKMRVACGSLDVPVIEALCISDGRFWSYCCDRTECCPAEGRPMGLPGTSVLAAAAAYAGVRVRGSLRELRARLLPWESGPVREQQHALETVGAELVHRIIDDEKRPGVAEETLEVAELLLSRFATAPPVAGTFTADLRDDELIGHDEAARLIHGLQDRAMRDRVAEWMEGDKAEPALRLWRALARRCVGPYREHAAAPLTLAGWVAWSSGDELEAREALAMALGADSDYLFARLLHQACNEGLDPESIRRCLRAERTGRERTDAGRTPACRPEKAELEASEVGEPVRGDAVDGASTPSTSGADDQRGARRPAGAVGGVPRSVRAAGRGRGAGRARTSSGARPGSERQGGTAPRVLRSAAPYGAKGTAARLSRKGAARRNRPLPDGVRSGNACAEGDE